MPENAAPSGSKPTSPTEPTAFVNEGASELGVDKSFFEDAKNLQAPDFAAISESTPLLQTATKFAKFNPKDYAEARIETAIKRLLAPLLKYVPDIKSMDGREDQSLMFKLVLEIYMMIRYTVPALWDNAQAQSVVAASTVSLGHLSTTTLAASTIANMTATMTGYSLIAGFTSALDSLLDSASDRRLASLWCQRMALFLALAIPPIFIFWQHTESILLKLGQDAEVASIASQFLKITALGLPAFAFNDVMKRYLATQDMSSVLSGVMTIAAPLSISLNYFLVDGPSMTNMGFIGAPIATLVCHNAIAILTILCLIIMRPKVRADKTSAVHGQPAFFAGTGKFLVSGLKGVGRHASLGWSKDLGGFVASMLGPNALAAQAVLLVTVSSMYQIPKSLNSTSSARVKKLIRSGDIIRAKIAAFLAFVATLFGVIVTSTILLLSADSWGSLFTEDPVVRETVAVAIPYISLFLIIHGLGSWVDAMLTALGKSAVFPALNASTDYTAGIPLGLWLAFPGGWGLGGLWTGLAASTAYSFAVSAVVMIRSDWAAAADGNAEGPTVQIVEDDNDHAHHV